VKRGKETELGGRENRFEGKSCRVPGSGSFCKSLKWVPRTSRQARGPRRKKCEGTRITALSELSFLRGKKSHGREGEKFGGKGGGAPS